MALTAAFLLLVTVALFPALAVASKEELPTLEFVGRHETHPSRFPLGRCKAHCRSNRDCRAGLTCQAYKGQHIHGCKIKKNNGLGRNYCLLPIKNKTTLARDVAAPPREKKPLTIVDLKKSDRMSQRLGFCEGPCRGHEDCGLGLNCYPFFTGGNKVPGCIGKSPGFKRFCYQPASTVLVRKAVQGVPADAYPLKNCQGVCNRGDSDCDLGLICYRRSDDQTIPGCRGMGIPGKNYCGFPTDPFTLVRMAEKNKPRDFLLDKCQGECTSNDQCKRGLKCFRRKLNEAVPGCTGFGIENGSYCFDPKDGGTAGQSKENKGGTAVGRVNHVACSPSSPCSLCYGDCNGKNANCRKGLVCFSKTVHNGIPGCGPTGLTSGVDYCAIPPNNRPMTFAPGNLQHVQAGLLLSKGLTARIIAVEHKHMTFDNGQTSRIRFHEDPDGAAVFENKRTGGWKYVSNAESSSKGGVGAIEFDAQGRVIGYEMLLSGTDRNCGGGRTFWNTWLSCEEYEDGQVWEVDPFGKHPPRKTIMGIKGGDMYESAAYDNRNRQKPVFYVTTDDEDGPVLKFTPDVAVTARALRTNDFSRLLHSNETGTAKTEFLVLQPDWKKSGEEGAFYWTDKIWLARASAKNIYPNCEGIDSHEGMVYFTCKRRAELFILDTDRGTYTKESIKSGAFNGNPDQVARIIGGGEEDDILYFCEAKGSSARDCGVFGRDMKGNYFTILENNGSIEALTGEVTGLAFSPNNKFMYLSYQKPGFIYEIKRTDGYPFGGQKLDILYHKQQ